MHYPGRQWLSNGVRAAGHHLLQHLQIEDFDVLMLNGNQPFLMKFG